MIKYKGKQYRNLQEQVLQNQDSIISLQDSKYISDLGIRVIQAEPLSTVEELPTDYNGEYGDAYLVGYGEPYTLYIWSRSNDPAVKGYWFKFGKLNAPSAVPGPKGETGEQGEQGTRGSLWNTQSGAPTKTQGVNEGDQALDGKTGNLYQFVGGKWQLVGNIMGPQGLQGIPGKDGEPGPQGEQGIPGAKGEQGQFIQIVGTLTAPEYLPDPNSVPRYAAYLIPINNVQHIYLVVGEATLSWYDAGGFGGGTSAFFNGLPVSQLDLTNVIPVPTLSPDYTTETTVREDSVDFTNLAVNGNNLQGEKAQTQHTSVSLPIGASEDVATQEEEKKLVFVMTEKFWEKVKTKIDEAQPPEVQILAPTTSNTGSVTDEQIKVLTSNQNAFLKLNDEIYRLQDVENVSDVLVYTHIGYEADTKAFIIKSVVITVSKKTWVLNVTGNNSLSTAQFSFKDGILTITNN